MTDFKRIADKRLSGLTMGLALVLRILLHTAELGRENIPEFAGKVVFR